MRNKQVVENRLQRLESEVKNVGYLIRTQNLDEAFNKIETILEHIGDIQTFLNGESQD
jgi:hypothetical protein